MLTVPESVIKTLQENLFAFLRKNRKDKIERAAKSKKRGLNIIKCFTIILSLRLAWISRLLDTSHDKWKAILNNHFRKHGSLLFLLKCNYDVKLLKTGLRFFYRELQYIQGLKN